MKIKIIHFLFFALIALSLKPAAAASTSFEVQEEATSKNHRGNHGGDPLRSGSDSMEVHDKDGGAVKRGGHHHFEKDARMKTVDALPPDERKPPKKGTRGGSDIDVINQGRHGSYEEASRNDSHEKEPRYYDSYGEPDARVVDCRQRKPPRKGTRGGSDIDVNQGRHGSYEEASRNDSYEEEPRYYDSYGEPDARIVHSHQRKPPRKGTRGGSEEEGHHEDRYFSEKQGSVGHVRTFDGQEGRWGWFSDLDICSDCMDSTPEDPANFKHAFIINEKRGLCLRAALGSGDGAGLDFRHCSGAAIQSWHLHNNGEIKFNFGGGLVHNEAYRNHCLTIDTDKKTVRFLTCASGASQKWIYDKGTLRIKNVDTNLCLEFKDGPIVQSGVYKGTIKTGTVSAKDCTTNDDQNQMFGFPSAITGPARGNFVREVQVLSVHATKISSGMADWWDDSQKGNTYWGGVLGVAGVACLSSGGTLCIAAAGFGLLSGALSVSGLWTGVEQERYGDNVYMSHGDQNDLFFYYHDTDSFSGSPEAAYSFGFKSGQVRKLDSANQERSRMSLDQDGEKICLWDYDECSGDDKLGCITFNKDHPTGVFSASTGKSGEGLYELEYKVIEKQDDFHDCHKHGDCPNKRSCSAGTQCSSGCCTKDLTSYDFAICFDAKWDVVCTHGPSNIPIGFHCDSDSDCASGACDIRLGVPNPTSSCECNDKTHFGCNVGAGEICMHRAMKANICEKPRGLGGTCEQDSDCASGSCNDGVFGVDGTCECNENSNAGCSQGQKCQYNSLSTNDCITPAKIGQWCNENSDCESGACDGGFWGGTCECNENSNFGCPHGHVCQHNSASPNACVPPNNRPNGMDCDNNNQCASDCCHWVNQVCDDWDFWDSSCW